MIPPPINSLSIWYFFFRRFESFGGRQPKILFFISLLLLLVQCLFAATPGLPFTEDFSSDAFIDKTKTTAAINAEEQAVRLAWAKRQYGVYRL